MTAWNGIGQPKNNPDILRGTGRRSLRFESTTHYRDLTFVNQCCANLQAVSLLDHDQTIDEP